MQDLLAATTVDAEAVNSVFNIACGERTTLNELFQLIRDNLVPYCPLIDKIEPQYGPFRKGDVRHSLADISRASQRLEYEPEYNVADGMAKAVECYARNLVPDLSWPSKASAVSHGV